MRRAQQPRSITPAASADALALAWRAAGANSIEAMPPRERVDGFHVASHRREMWPGAKRPMMMPR